MYLIFTFCSEGVDSRSETFLLVVADTRGEGGGLAVLLLSTQLRDGRGNLSIALVSHSRAGLLKAEYSQMVSDPSDDPEIASVLLNNTQCCPLRPQLPCPTAWKWSRFHLLNLCIIN